MGKDSCKTEVWKWLLKCPLEISSACRVGQQDVLNYSWTCPLCSVVPTCFTFIFWVIFPTPPYSLLHNTFLPQVAVGNICFQVYSSVFLNSWNNARFLWVNLLHFSDLLILGAILILLVTLFVSLPSYTPLPFHFSPLSPSTTSIPPVFHCILPLLIWYPCLFSSILCHLFHSSAT